MMWILIAIATVETLVVHLLVALWRPWIAAGLSALSIATIVWLVMSILSFRRLPVELTPTHLHWRVGGLKGATVAVEHIGALSTSWAAADVKGRRVLNCALIAYPNTVLELNRPIKVGRRRVSTLAHRLDDPAAFATALATLLKDRA